MHRQPARFTVEGPLLAAQLGPGRRRDDECDALQLIGETSKLGHWLKRGLALLDRVSEEGASVPGL
jgi:hypothetical protein